MAPTAESPPVARLLRPGDAGYDARRAQHNARLAPRPALIAPCAGPDEVAAAVRLGRDRGLTIGVRGGGLGAGPAGGGLTIDLRDLATVRVDPARRVAVVGGGATWRALDAAAQAHGLAVTGARVAAAGVAGTVLGCGSGWLERAMGLSSDSLLAAEVVTAEGGRVRTSRVEHPDLFWTLHGGGTGAVVVTSIALALRPLGPRVPARLLTFPLDRGEAVLRRYAELMAGAPDVLCGGAVIGAGSLAVVAMWAGEPAAAAPWLDRLDRLGPAVGDHRGAWPYVAIQRGFGALSPPGLRGEHRSGFLRTLDNGAIGRLLTLGAAPPSPRTSLLLQPLGGAYARLGEDSALGHRGAGWAFQVLAHWSDADADGAMVAWVRRAIAELATVAGSWPAFAATPDEAFDAATHRRLARIARRWDPHGVLSPPNPRVLDPGTPE